MAEDAEGDKVGYGRPPSRSRFKPGRSGNPKGRPPKSRNLKTNVIEELRKMVSIREGSKERRVSKVEAVAIRLVNRALTGDSKAIEAILKIDDRVDKEGGHHANSDLMTAEEHEVFDLLRHRLGQKPEVAEAEPTTHDDTSSTNDRGEPDDDEDDH